MANVTIKTVIGNTAPPITLTAKRDGVVIDLTGCTVKLYITLAGTQTNTGHESCTVTDATNGEVEYDREAGDLTTRGSYKCDLKVTYGDATQEVLYDILVLKARARLAGE